MKKIITTILLSLFVAAGARADTTLIIPALYNCLLDFGGIFAIVNPPTVNSTFTLTGVSGSGVLQSQIPTLWDEHVPPANNDQKLYTYSYTLDLSGMSSAANHCVKLLIHFGDPTGCSGPGVQGSPSQIQSATLAQWGDITFVFNSGCLNPGQPAISFSMVSESGFKTNFVTVIDDYVDLISGQTNELRMNVPAIVPDIPPDPPSWVISYYAHHFHDVIFQGGFNYLVTNIFTNFPPINGNYDFTLQLLPFGTNGPVASLLTTQTVSVVNGLFTVPLPGDPTSFGDGSVRFVNIGVRPTGGTGGFTQLNPPLAMSPTPQALYAFSAGSVADLAPGQAVLSLNGLTDAVNLQAGTGIALGITGNTITISQTGAPSDYHIKTGFATVSPEQILDRLLVLPLQSWSYTNDVAGVRHLGPMAQDFHEAFGLNGTDDKHIAAVDEGGVALAAIQGLNQKLESESKDKDAEIAELKARLEKLEQQINSKNGGDK
jgi:hypothetical protein